MPKNIVILCDGTSNEIEQDRTNILRLYGTLEKSDRQIVYYDPGVGTFGASNSASYYSRRAAEVWGLLTGWGLDANVLQAYRFLLEHYDHGEKEEGKERLSDNIYLFGYSRGAYTARVLAGFLRAFGFIHPNNLNLLEYAYRAYKRISDRHDHLAEDKEHAAFAEIRLYERILRPTRPHVTCLGLFDTVGSVIESGRFGYRLRSHAFTARNWSVKAVRHAVALDERRTMFQPQLWPKEGVFRRSYFHKTTEQPQDVKEVWFVGSHGDVGGGLPETKSQLAKIPLVWMIDETRALGLHYKDPTVRSIVLGEQDEKYISPNAATPINDSRSLGWSLLEIIPRRVRKSMNRPRFSIGGFYLPLFEPRTVPENAVLHESVSTHDNSKWALKRPFLPSNTRTESQTNTVDQQR